MSRYYMGVEKPYFEAIEKKKKNFVLTNRPTPFRTGDWLTLYETAGRGGRTGRKTQRKIGYILRDCPECGLAQGYCILSLI